MKYLLHIPVLLFIACFCASNITYAQQPLNQINIVSFSVKNKLPAEVNSWDNIPASILLVAQKLPQIQLQSLKLVIQIKLAGSRVCGNSPQTAILMDAFSIRNFSAGELIGMLAQCPKLAINNYTLCAQFFNVDNYPISKEFCKDFMVGDIAISYSPPQNMTPTNEKKLDATALKMPITFRWIPVIPRLKDPVTYRLRVWQLMQGQTGLQAMKANTPIVYKEVKNITQAIVTNMITEPCQQPYLCEFVWTVQALDKDEKPIGKNNGMSEMSSFKIK
jgi:hypothetical protein